MAYRCISQPGQTLRVKLADEPGMLSPSTRIHRISERGTDESGLQYREFESSVQETEVVQDSGSTR